MKPLALHELQESLNARMIDLRGMEAVADYGNPATEYRALTQAAGVLDLGFRGRICLTGADRIRFLHGQVTNDIKRLRPGRGCYAALVTAKGKMQSDLNVYCLEDELLLDFEPGLAESVSQRLEKYMVADDVQVVDVEPLYGLLSVQGPQTSILLRELGLPGELPAHPFDSHKLTDPTLGELYLMNQPRLGSAGFDLFAPVEALNAVADRLIAAAKHVGGTPCGCRAFETVRIEAGIPRFGCEMDEELFPLECGIEARAVSYSKGCYIGQEILNRIHTLGHVNRELRGLRLPADLERAPAKGDKLFLNGKEAGYITSAAKSPALDTFIALGCIRREANSIGTELTLRMAAAECRATIVPLPFVPSPDAATEVPG